VGVEEEEEEERTDGRKTGASAVWARFLSIKPQPPLRVVKEARRKEEGEKVQE
jgi:hypothetical protein